MTKKVALRAFTQADQAALERWATDTRACTTWHEQNPVERHCSGKLSLSMDETSARFG